MFFLAFVTLFFLNRSAGYLEVSAVKAVGLKNGLEWGRALFSRGNVNVGRPAVGLGSRMFSIPAFTTGAYGKVYAIHWGIGVPSERIGVVCQGFHVFRTVTSFRVSERVEVLIGGLVQFGKMLSTF